MSHSPCPDRMTLDFNRLLDCYCVPHVFRTLPPSWCWDRVRYLTFPPLRSQSGWFQVKDQDGDTPEPVQWICYSQKNLSNVSPLLSQMDHYHISPNWFSDLSFGCLLYSPWTFNNRGKFVKLLLISNQTFYWDVHLTSGTTDSRYPVPVYLSVVLLDTTKVKSKRITLL